jgi:RND family efflux transporter MFP subunit
VAAARAAVESAKLNLSYTKIHSPIDGRASRHLVDVGNLVGADGPTLLTTVVSINPIYVYFTVNEREVAEYLREVNRHGRMGEKGEDTRPPVFELALPNDEGYPHKGVLDYWNNQVDADTGTIQARGVLPNDSNLLLPGFFANIRAPQGVQKDALLVPDRAVSIDQAGRYLLLVDDKDTVQRRQVGTGGLVGSLRVIEEGLTAHDRVVVKGLLRARPGSKVTPVRAKAGEKRK